MADPVPAPQTPEPHPRAVDGVIDRWDAFAERFRVPLAAASIAWFAASCAEYAGFIDLPVDLPLSEWFGIVPAVLWNAVWWGFAYPRLERRRKERAGALQVSQDIANG